MAADERSYLFLVRLWLPVSDGEGHDQAPQEKSERQWQGKVQPVLGARAGYFEDWSGLIDTLLNMLPQEDEICRQGESGEQTANLPSLSSLLSTAPTRAT